MSNNKSLLDSISKKQLNVEIVKNVSQVDDSKPNIKFVGANWCGYSKSGAIQFNEACGDMKEGKCYLFDTTVPESAKAANELGLKVEGFPTHFIIDSKGKQELLVGMRPKEDLKKSLKQLGFDFR